MVVVELKWSGCRSVIFGVGELPESNLSHECTYNQIDWCWKSGDGNAWQVINAYYCWMEPFKGMGNGSCNHFLCISVLLALFHFPFVFISLYSVIHFCFVHKLTYCGSKFRRFIVQNAVIVVGSGWANQSTQSDTCKAVIADTNTVASALTLYTFSYLTWLSVLAIGSVLTFLKSSWVCGTHGHFVQWGEKKTHHKFRITHHGSLKFLFFGYFLWLQVDWNGSWPWWVHDILWWVVFTHHK